MKVRSKSVSTKRKSNIEIPRLESDMLGDNIFDSKPEENKVIEATE